MPIQFVVFCLALISILFVFQNCAEPQLSLGVKQNALSEKTIQGELCVSKNANDSSFEPLLILAVNATAKLDGESLVADSDMDGLSDSYEENSSFNFDPIKRRTFGILDGLCLQAGGLSCEKPAASCDGSNLSLGLNNCDLLHVPDSPIKGVNSDAYDRNYNSDVIPDFIEILKGSNLSTNLLYADSDINYDSDDLDNLQEISIGRDPDNTEDYDVPQERLLSLSYSPKGADNKCNGNLLYSIKVDAPLVKTLAFTDEAELSHAMDENVILIYVVSKNAANETQFWLAKKNVPFEGTTVKDELSLTPDDFNLIGTYEELE